MRYRASRASGLLISVLALLLVPTFLVAAEQAAATKLAISDAPVAPVLSPPLRDVVPIYTPGGKDPSVVRNFELPHPGWIGDRPVRPDGAVQSKFGITAPDPTGTNVDGLGANGSAPPDNDGGVGPNHYVQMINTQFAIFDKAGTKLYGPANNNTLFLALGSSNSCVRHNDGDPIVKYDQLADRWILTQFVVFDSPNVSHQCVAISVTGDPLGSYYLYDFITDSVNLIDYPHLGVWPDSYYMSVHIFNAAGTAYLGQGVFAFERPKMLVGLPARLQGANLASINPNFGGALPSDLDGLTPPPSGSPNYFIMPGSPELDGSASPVLHIFKVSATWGATPALTITGPTDVATAPFRADVCGFGACVPQSGTTTVLDAIPDRFMWRLAYRNNAGTEQLVMNHTVDVLTPPANQAGVRWYELRSPGSSPTIFQQGTYAPDALHRWMGSISMDNSGNMALGYSKSSSGIFPEIDLTGRLVGDAPGTMGAEIVMKAGVGSQTGGLTRWGDYTAMTIDPRDGCTFWYTNQYQPANGSFNWATRIANFHFPSCVSPARGTITGYVRDASGLPIAGALVSVSNGFSGATDATGKYTIVLPPGSYTVIASADQRNCTPSASQPATVVNGGVTTLNFTLSGTALLALGPVGIDDSSGNGNGVINKNECVTLNLPLNNAGCALASNISAVLTTSTSGVTIQQGTSTYPNLPVGASAGSNTPFKFATSSSFVCGTPISFLLTVTSSAGTTPLAFSLPTCTKPPFSQTGVIDNADPTQTARMFRDGLPSACGGTKPCAGPTGSGPRHFDSYTFTNGATTSRCVTVTTVASCAGASGNIFSAAYLGSYNPASLCANFIADAGFSYNNGFPGTYSFDIAPGATFVVVVNEVASPLLGCTSYSITVDGLLDTADGGRPAAPTAGSNSPICAGGTLNLTASTVPGASYLWTGPNGFTSTQQNPSIPNATAAASGTYSVVAIIGGCSSDPATTTVVVNTTCSSFFTVTPCRLIDTRTTDVPALAAGGSRTFILAGSCGIPSTAQAVAINVAATNETSGGNLQVFAGGSPVPPTSVLNYNAGKTRANNAIVTLGAGGTITIKCNQPSGTADVVVDVNGYFQ